MILGPDGVGKSSVIAGLLIRLEAAGWKARMRHLKPHGVARLLGRPMGIVVDPHAKAPRGALISLIKIVVWLAEEWCEVIFREERGTCTICDRYYHDLLVDPRRFRFGAPLGTAAWIGRLMPQPSFGSC